MNGRAKSSDQMWAGLALLVVANFFFAVGFSFAHYAGGRISPWHLLFCRSLIYLFFLIPWAVAHPRQARGVNRGGLVLRGVLGTTMLSCMIFALSVVPLSTGAALGKTTPLWAIFVLWALFSIPPTAVELTAVLVAVGGILLVLHPQGHQHLGNVPLIGIVLALAAGFFNSLEFVTLRRIRQTDGANTINLWYAGVMLLVTLPLALTQPWPQKQSFLLIAIMFGISTLVGQTLLAQSLRSVTATAASVATLLMPVFATVIGWMVFRQKLSALELLGLALVIGAGTAVIFMENRRPRLSGLPAFRWQRAREGEGQD